MLASPSSKPNSHFLAFVSKEGCEEIGEVPKKNKMIQLLDHRIAMGKS